MKDKINSIKQLKQFFIVSTAAFEFTNIVKGTFSKLPVPETMMHTLHKQALIELEKPWPDMLVIDKLLEAMEEEAENNK